MTVKKQKLFLHVIDRPTDGKLLLPGFNSKVKKVYRLDDARKMSLRMMRDGRGLMVELPAVQSKDPLLNAVQVVVVEF